LIVRQLQTQGTFYRPSSFQSASKRAAFDSEFLRPLCDREPFPVEFNESFVDDRFFVDIPLPQLGGFIAVSASAGSGCSLPQIPCGDRPLGSAVAPAQIAGLVLDGFCFS
jgi:hypothetical protein